MEQPVSSGHTFARETETQATCRSHIIRLLDARPDHGPQPLLWAAAQSLAGLHQRQDALAK